MKLRLWSVLGVIACLAVMASAWAQAGDPLSGKWSGDWGPNPGDRNNVTVDLKWDGKALTGNVTGGLNVRGNIPLHKAAFDPKTGVIHMEADAPGRGAETVHFVIDGKVDKASMAGTWNHDNRKGDFKLTKQ